MIVSLQELMAYPEFRDADENYLSVQLESIEDLIRAYTHNSFQIRSMRIEAESFDNEILGTSPYFKVGDTIEISKSNVNDGLYVIREIQDEKMQLDKDVYNGKNLITKVEYPKAIKKGVVDIMKWEMSNRDKVGIQSESIARHSVTYFNLDGDNSLMGYPKSILGFLNPYMRARF